ncbi:MAG: enoyl-CoA hydratase/isomerase family protein [Candidatus Omnitrophica bacterium]|nr:enoyl-CoA hydratase/isomerase family protein [Candidatus Omnitrophota bacterium]
MADRQFIKVAIEEDVAVITIDRPPVNALSMQTMQELDSAIDELSKDDGVKAIVITGGGTYAFVAGADVSEIAQITSPDVGKNLALKGQAVLDKIEALKKPIIAAINSVCLGGGNELAMACHMRVASDRARFGQPEINLGIIPGFGGTQRLSRLCGASKARELVLTGDMITAQEALRIGLVNKVVPDGEVLKQAKGLAKKIATKGAVAVRLAQQAIAEGSALPLKDGLRKEAELFGEVCKTDDMKEGVKAFLEKRQPKFQHK